MSNLRGARRLVWATAWVLWLALGVPARAAEVGYAFTYQGSLNDAGASPTGPYDFKFSLWDAAMGGTQIEVTTFLNDVPVVGGIFTVELDFSERAFYGPARWLQVEARQGASGGGYTLFPRQKLTPNPVSIGLSLPHDQRLASSSALLSFLNSGTGNAGNFFASGTGLNYALLGSNASTGSQAAGVRGISTATSGQVIGVEGRATTSPSGTGLVGAGAATGAYITASGAGSTGTYSYGGQRGAFVQGTGAGATGLEAQGSGLAISATNTGAGSAIFATGNGATRDNATVRIVNTQPSAGMCQYVSNNSTWATSHLQNDGSGEILWLEHGGTGHFIVAVDPSGWQFWVDNAGVTHTKVLEILGGSDLSERFDVEDEAAVEPGSVVCIDPENEGRLVVSRAPYDRRVAGIVSGAGGVKPGMLMGQQGSVADGAHPVALTGRVYCRATAANGPIRPGDLLTSSGVPGHAMRVDDHARGQGAIIGKAMGSLEEGEGLVLVLVGLQ